MPAIGIEFVLVKTGLATVQLRTLFLTKHFVAEALAFPDFRFRIRQCNAQPSFGRPLHPGAVLDYSRIYFEAISRHAQFLSNQVDRKDALPALTGY